MEFVIQRRHFKMRGSLHPSDGKLCFEVGKETFEMRARRRERKIIFVYDEEEI